MQSQQISSPHLNHQDTTTVIKGKLFQDIISKKAEDLFQIIKAGGEADGLELTTSISAVECNKVIAFNVHSLINSIFLFEGKKGEDQIQMC